MIKIELFSWNLNRFTMITSGFDSIYLLFFSTVDALLATTLESDQL